MNCELCPLVRTGFTIQDLTPPAHLMKILAQHGAFFAAGFLAVAAQVLLLRELVVDVAGDELAIGVGLGAWLLGIARTRLARQDIKRAINFALKGISICQKMEAEPPALGDPLRGVAVDGDVPGRGEEDAHGLEVGDGFRTGEC